MEAGLVGKKKKGKTWNNIPELQHDELENTMKELDAIAENNKYLWQEDKNDMQQCIIIDYEALPFVSRLYIPEVAAAELEELYKDIKQDQDTEKGWKSSLNLEYKKYWQEHYIYDAASNIDFRLDGWGKLDFTYSKANELKQIGNRQYHYDNNGNLMHEELDKLEISYSYTAENRLQEVNTEWQWINTTSSICSLSLWAEKYPARTTIL